MLKRWFWTAAFVVFASTMAYAQSSLGIGSNEVAPTPAAGGIFGWIYSQQQHFFRALQSALKLIRDGGTGGILTLTGLSFAYGIFHAAGPGHGKAVISSYMLANELALKRGIILSFASSLAQAISAIILVGAGFLVLRGAAITMTDATWFLEMASYAMIAGFGAYLLWRKLSGTSYDHGHASNQEAGHIHDEKCTHNLASAKPATNGFVCESCGHSHAPDPQQLTGKNVSLRDAWGIVAAVGIRPCSGAIVVLSFALLNGLYAAGLASVLMMALGTAITVSALAAVAVYAKDVALKLSGTRSNWIGSAIETSGACLVLVLGLGLLYAGFT
ncbi:MAG: nickel/cobalt transporter, partial [Notoacmeibacter sp.]